MKSRGIRSFIGLIIVAGLAAWFNYNPEQQSTDVQSSLPKQNGNYILAVSWHASFCEQKPSKPECRQQADFRFKQEELVLHGLWVQPRSKNYCGVPQTLVRLDKSGNWNQLPKLELSQGTRERLAKVMPGYRSFLHRHEWFKHGSCMAGYSPEEYFNISLNLMDDLRTSKFAVWMQSNIGRRVDYRQVEKQFETSFGKGAGDRLVVDCYRDDGRRIVQELKISLAGKFDRNTILDEALERAPKLGGSCPNGVVDPAGLQ